MQSLRRSGLALRRHISRTPCINTCNQQQNIPPYTPSSPSCILHYYHDIRRIHAKVDCDQQNSSNTNGHENDNIEVTVQSIEDNLSIIQYGASKKIFLLGVTHKSVHCAQQVRELMDEVQPDTLVVELCKQRAAFLRGQIKKYKRKVRDGDSVSNRERDKLVYGGEFRTALAEAQRIGCKVVCADMDEEILFQKNKFSLKHALTNPSLSLSDRWKLRLGVVAWRDFISLQWSREKTAIRLMQRDRIQERLDFFAAKAPQFYLTMVVERNEKLSTAMRDCEGSVVVAVVGTDHMPGIEERFKENFKKTEDMELLRHANDLIQQENLERMRTLGSQQFSWIDKQEFGLFKHSRDLPQKYV